MSGRANKEECVCNGRLQERVALCVAEAVEMIAAIFDYSVLVMDTWSAVFVCRWRCAGWYVEMSVQQSQPDYDVEKSSSGSECVETCARSESGAAVWGFRSLFRQFSAWYHRVCAASTTEVFFLLPGTSKKVVRILPECKLYAAHEVNSR